jgi:hypothetical protein
MKREEDVIRDAGMELVKALGLTADKEKLERVYMELMRFQPTVQPDGEDWGWDFKKEPAPMFTEGYLYAMLGKDEARTVLGKLRRVLEAAGMPRDEQNRLSCLADKTQECEFCWGDGYRGDDTCNVCKGKGYRKPGEDWGGRGEDAAP